MKLFLPGNAEKCDGIFDEIEDGAGRIHASPSGTGIYHAGSSLLFVVADMRVPEENIVVILRFDGFKKTLFVVTVKYRNLPSGQIELTKAP